jgi:hypothetical protein
VGGRKTLIDFGSVNPNMRDLYKSIDYIERGMSRGLDRRRATSSSASPALPKEMVAPKSSIRGWRAPITSDVVYPEQVFRSKNKPGDKPNAQLRDTSRETSSRDLSMTKLTLSARALKITVPLDAMEVRTLPDPGNQQARCQLAIACDGKIYTADIATKSLRKAKSTISANGAENVFVGLQGRLKGDEIVECGLVAQVKTPKPAAPVASSSAPSSAAVEAASAA